MPRIATHTRVVRGPDWREGNDDDGGEGGLGTVTDVDQGTQLVGVDWDNGKVGAYHAGHQNKYELLLYDNSPVLVVRHYFVTCDGCEEAPIRGLRWSCLDCYDYDLCTTCYMKDEHELNHGFIRMITNDSCGVPVPVRNGAERIRTRGLCPGASIQYRKKDKVSKTAIDSIIGKVVSISKESTATISLEDGTLVDNLKLYQCDPDFELSVVEPSSGDGSYYKDHLPKLGEDDTVCNGDRVSVVDDKETFKKLQEKHRTGWKEGMEKLIGKIGVVFQAGGVLCSVGYVDALPVDLNPEVVTKIKRFSQNEVVRITDDFDTASRLHKQKDGMDEKVEKVLGKEGKVLATSLEGRITVHVEGKEKIFLHPGCLQYVREGVESGATEAAGSTFKPATGAKSPADSSDEEGSVAASLLLAAAIDGDASTIENIITDNPEVVNQRVKGSAAVHVAASRAGVEGLRVIVEAGGKVDLRDRKRSTPLHYAAEGGQEESIRYLLEKGADVNATNQNGHTALHAAANKNHDDCIRILLEKGINVDLADNRQTTGFHVCAAKGHVESAKVLIEAGCDINTQDKDGDTPTHDAVLRFNNDVIDLVLEHPKYDPRLTNKKGFNVIQYAALRDRPHALEKIVEKFPDLVNLQRNDGHSAFHIAVYNSHLDCARHLYEKAEECDINIKNKNGQTPLHLAVETGHMAELEYLLTIDADVNVHDVAGKTCLHMAASNYKMNKDVTTTPTLDELKKKYRKYGVTSTTATLMCLLVKHKADVTAKDKRGRTPLSYVDNQEFKALLEKLARNDDPKGLESEPQTSEGNEAKEVEEKAGTVIEGLHRISISQITTEKMLGRGSFGLVTKATWRGTPVAVKAIPIDVAVRERVEQQLSVHRQTTHPNIVELMALSFNPEKSEILIVMEFIDGKSLYDIIFPLEGPVELNRQDKISISKQILKAMSFIHRSHILHLNIKPANILLNSKTKKAFLSDLGLAHMNFTSTSEGDERDGFQGTVNYIPPEGVNLGSGATSDRFTPAYDIWSLGGTLLETFTEMELWGDDVEVYFVIAQLIQGAQPPILSEADEGVRKLLKPCFETDPEKRPTASKLLTQFENFS